MKPRSARIIKALAILLVVLAALYGIAWLLAARSLRQAYAELEADGRPMTLEEIELDPVSPAQNAAPLYQAARLLLQSESVGNASMFEHLSTNTCPTPNDPRSPEAIDAELREVLKQKVCIAALNLLKEGSTRPDYRNSSNKAYEPPVSPLHIGDDNETFRLVGMFSLGRLLNAQARIQMADGSPDEAWATATSSFRFAHSFSKIPTMVGQLLKVLLASFAAETARDLCMISIPDPEHLDELQQLLRTFDNPVSFARAIDIERIVFDHQFFRNPSAKITTGDGSFSLAETLLFRLSSLKPIRMADYAFELRAHHRLAQAYEQMDEGNTLQPDDIFPQPPFYCLLSRIASMPDKRQNIRPLFANIRITSAGLAAMQYHQEHGFFPETLAELGDLNLTDPFTGAELAYRAEPDGFVISSVGPKDGPEDDIVWQYKTPAHESSPPDP